MSEAAEVFLDHGRQAIRLPQDIHVTGEILMVRQDAGTGDIILSTPHTQQQKERQRNWEAFFALRDSLTQEERDEFVIPRDLAVPEPRDF